jgi:hypothetical protein
MTHAELRATVPAVAGLEPVDCVGELEPAGEHTGTDGHLITLYRCRACTATVVHDLTDERIRNDYLDPRRLIKDLAIQVKRQSGR